MKQYEKDALMDHGNRYVNCTLNGMPARICGRLNDVATITDGDRAADFSWHAVDRILDQGGDFEF